MIMQEAIQSFFIFLSFFKEARKQAGHLLTGFLIMFKKAGAFLKRDCASTARSSKQTPYPSLCRKRQSSSIALLRLSKSEPLRWVLIWFWGKKTTLARRQVLFRSEAAAG